MTFREANAGWSHVARFGAATVALAILATLAVADGGHGGNQWYKDKSPQTSATPDDEMEWAGNTAHGKRYTKEAGDEDRITVTINGCNVSCFGHFRDASESNGSSSISGGGVGSATIHQHAEHNKDDIVGWSATQHIFFQTKGEIRCGKSVRVSANGSMTKLTGGTETYAYAATLGMSTTEKSKRVIKEEHTGNTSARLRARANANGQAGTAGSGTPPAAQGTVTADAEAEIGTVTSETSVTEGEERTQGQAASQSLDGEKAVEYTRAEDGCVFSMTFTGDHHLTMSGQASAFSAASADVNPSETRMQLTLRFVINTLVQPPEQGWPCYVMNGTTTYAAQTEPVSGRTFAMTPSGAVGLATEAGRTRGAIVIECDVPVAAATTFAIAATPAGYVTAPPSITIPANGALATVDFEADQAGEATLALTLLDSSGAPTSFVLSKAATSVSLVSVAAPTLYCVWPDSRVEPAWNWMDTGAVKRFGIRAGSAPGAVVVRRTGFADYDTAATTVTVAESDPDGVIGPTLASEVTIPAGENSVQLEIPLTGVAGDATVTLTAGAATAAIPIRVAAQSWSAGVSKVELPVNAKCAFVPISLALAEDADRALTAVVGDPGRLQVLSGWDTDIVRPWQRTGLFPVAAVATGTTTLTISSSGLSSIELPVEIHGAEVTVSATTVTLSQLLGDEGGAILLLAPPGRTWASFVPPTGTEPFLDIAGVGTPLLELTFADGVVRTVPTIVANYSFGGTSEGPHMINVHDALHYYENRLNYDIEVD